jgi:hypothetical protein
MVDPAPLHFGLVSHPVKYGADGAVEVDYAHSVDEGRRYPVILHAGNLHEEAGTCRIRRTANGAFEVFDFQSGGLELQFGWDLADSKFYGSFVADEDGRATLEEVLLVVPQP